MTITTKKQQRVNRQDREIVISGWRPHTLNQLMRVHWSKRRKAKASDAMVIAAELHRAGMPKAECPRELEVVWVVGPHPDQAPDPDNIWKSLLDALVSCGALVDDCRHFCRLRYLRFERSDAKGIKIRLKDV
jgi:Holliday junction resolvase RusA-like endonuclease